MKKALLSLLLTIAIMPLAIGQRPATSSFVTTDTTACGSFKWTNDSVYTTSTVDFYTSGDTVYVLSLTLEPPQIDTATAIPVSGTCYALYNNKEWRTPGTFLDTVRVEGQSCDNVVKIEVTLGGQDTIDAEIDTACTYYVASWGDTITSSVMATDTNIMTSTCNLLVHTLNITVIPTVASATEQIAVEGCSYDWNGTIIDVADSVYYDTIILANGCDSVSSLKVTSFTNRIYDTTDIVACDYYVYGNDTITADTTITTIDNTTACHNYSLLRIIIRQNSRDTASAVVRDTVGGCSLTWYGETYTLADTMTAIYAMGTTTLGDCDSLMAIRITAFDGMKHDTTSMEYCGYYLWHGDTIRTTGEHTHIETTEATTTAPACTTTHHLFFTRISNSDEVTPQAACGELVYTFNSRQGRSVKDTARFTTSGTYATDMNGDSIYSKDRNTECITFHTLHVTVHPIRQSDTLLADTTVCERYLDRFNGTLSLTRSIDTCIIRSFRGRTAKDCVDSVKHLILTVNKRTYADYDTTVCDAFTWTGFTNTTYTQSVVDSLKLTNTKNSVGCDSIGRLNLTVHKSPKVVIEGAWNLEPNANGEGTASLQAVCNDEAVTYAWFVGTSTTPASTEATFQETVSNNTDIRLETTNSEGCVAKNWITITLNVGIDETEAADVKIYPNPATRFINIDCSEGISGIAVYNAIGQQVISQRQITGTHATLDLGQLSNGAYTLRIASSNGSQSNHKFIINK